MKLRTVLLISLLLLIGLVTHAAITAKEILSQTLSAMNDTPALTAGYDIAGEDGNAGGTITISGKRFFIEGDGIRIWYDGHTQWSYTERTGEVNVTEPTDEELAEINPLYILNSDADAYALKLKKREKTRYIIELTDRSEDLSISKATVTVSAQDMLPSSAKIEMASGEVFTLTLKNIKKLKSIDSAVFRFNPKDYPGVEVIDLR